MKTVEIIGYKRVNLGKTAAKPLCCLWRGKANSLFRSNDLIPGCGLYQ